MHEILLDDCRPSGFARVIACPGSRRLTVKAPVGSGSSVYAREGTAAHDLASRCLETNTLPLEHLGEKITVEGDVFEVTMEMVIAVQHHVGHCRAIMKRARWFAIEERLNIPNLDMRRGGTGDFVAMTETEGRRVVDVVDLKYGSGVYVEETGNAQFLSYGWGALNSMPYNVAGSDVQINLTCTQPRIKGADPVRTWTIDGKAMNDWLNNVAYPAIEASRKGDAPLVPGDHCRFCDAKGFCTAPLQKAAETMKAMR